MLSQRFGPSNGWTGSHGVLSAALLKCVRAYRALTERPDVQTGLWDE